MLEFGERVYVDCLDSFGEYLGINGRDMHSVSMDDGTLVSLNDGEFSDADEYMRDATHA